MTEKQSERGVVSIITVILFTLLLSIIGTSFLRLTIREQALTLQDEQSKNAYNAALAGAEDAKRAIIYCNSLSGVERSSCEAALYTTTCPGFNSSNYFASNIGIPQAVNGKTVIDSVTAQGYGCVIVSRESESLDGRLLANQGSSGFIRELSTASPHKNIRIAWHDLKNVPTLPSETVFFNGNPRQGDWGAKWPAALRVTIISTPQTTPYNDNGITMRSYFIYPTNRTDMASRPGDVADSATSRVNTNCVASGSTYGKYACGVDITFNEERSNGRYVIIQALYRSTDFAVTASNSTGNAVNFSGVQPTIDSTGYSNETYRRVKESIKIGGNSLTSANALDLGTGLCKSFSVGINSFSDSDCTNN